MFKNQIQIRPSLALAATLAFAGSQLLTLAANAPIAAHDRTQTSVVVPVSRPHHKAIGRIMAGYESTKASPRHSHAPTSSYTPGPLPGMPLPQPSVLFPVSEPNPAPLLFFPVAALSYLLLRRLKRDGNSNHNPKLLCVSGGAGGQRRGNSGLALSAPLLYRHPG